MRRNGFRHAETITRAQARAQLALLLANASDEKLAGFTVDKLAALNRTPRAEIQAMLYDAQRARQRPRT